MNVSHEVMNIVKYENAISDIFRYYASNATKEILSISQLYYPASLSFAQDCDLDFLIEMVSRKEQLKMSISLTRAGRLAAGAVGASAVAGAMLFGGTPIAQAAPPLGPDTSFQMSGPHGVPLRPGGGGGGGGHGGGGHGGGWGGHGGGWGGHGGNWGGHGGNWGGHGGNWGGHGGNWGGHNGWWGGHPGWGNGGWGPPGLGYRPWWNNWWW
jgi:hypothetical protein